MGRPKKVVIEELAAESPVKKPSVKTVEAKHVVTYSEPMTIPVADSEPDETEEWLAEDADEATEEPKASRPPSLRARLKERLEKAGVAGTQLRLRIDRLPLYEINGLSGINAEKEFVRVVSCTESYFDTEDYLENIRAFSGPGTYWLTVRAGKSIVAQWQEKIAGTPQNNNSGTPENPAPIQYQPAAAIDPMASLLKQAKQFGELRKLLAPEIDSQPARVSNDGQQTTEQALLTLMNTDNALVETVASKLGKMFRGNGSSSAEPERSWLDVLYMAIERDTLPKLINQFATQFRPGGTAANGDAPAQPTAPTEQQPSADVVAYQRLVAVLVGCLRTNGDVMPALQAIDGFLALFPEHAAAVDSFLTAPAEIALPALAQSSPMAAEAIALPHAAEWVGKLKAAYFEEIESEEPKE
jgi:hypothetical protein